MPVLPGGEFRSPWRPEGRRYQCAEYVTRGLTAALGRDYRSRVHSHGFGKAVRPRSAQLVLTLALLIAVCASATPAAAGPAVSFAVPPSSGCGPSNVEGWEFHTTASVTVSALGVFDRSPSTGLNFSIPVGLYDSACTLLASTVIPAGISAAFSDDYRYVGITPVVLPAGQAFRVGAVIRCEDRTPLFASLASVSLDPGLTAVQTRRIGFGSSLACPTETGSLFSFAPNFLIGPACGNGVVQAGEECDDGNTDSGDCCSPTCEYEENGSPCTPTPTATATLGPTGTVTSTVIDTTTPTAATTAPATITPLPTATDTPATAACAGDCDGSGDVAINELVTGVSIALGSQPIGRCPAFDSSGNGAIEINELVLAVNNALNGCP